MKQRRRCPASSRSPIRQTARRITAQMGFVLPASRLAFRARSAPPPTRHSRSGGGAGRARRACRWDGDAARGSDPCGACLSACLTLRPMLRAVGFAGRLELDGGLGGSPRLTSSRASRRFNSAFSAVSAFTRSMNVPGRNMPLEIEDAVDLTGGARPATSISSVASFEMFSGSHDRSKALESANRSMAWRLLSAAGAPASTHRPSSKASPSSKKTPDISALDPSIEAVVQSFDPRLLCPRSSG